MSDQPRSPWDRLPKEGPRAHEYFRRFRDLGPLRRPEMLVTDELKLGTIRRWQQEWDWRDRAAAWDEEVHRQEDAQRLEALRGMHDRHQRAGRMAMAKAVAALSKVEPEDIPPYAAARLLELGARLEREILIHSVEELQGAPPLAAEDPWESIGRELDQLPSSGPPLGDAASS